MTAELEKIKTLLDGYSSSDHDLFKNTVDMLCSKGLAKGCYQDYGVLTDVLSVLCLCEKYISHLPN